jgi:HEPN domain-containing protein
VFRRSAGRGKTIKAVFIDRSEPFPYVHELKELLQKLKRNGLKIPKYVWEADELSDYAVLTRYPGKVAPVKAREHRRAVRIATAVLRWAERQIGQP